MPHNIVIKVVQTQLQKQTTRSRTFVTPQLYIQWTVCSFQNDMSRGQWFRRIHSAHDIFLAGRSYCWQINVGKCLAVAVLACLLALCLLACSVLCYLLRSVGQSVAGWPVAGGWWLVLPLPVVSS